MLLLAVRLQFTWILKLIFEFLGGWQGSAQFRLDFNHGGAIEFGQNVLKTASNPPVIAPVPTMVNPMTGDPFIMGGIYPPPPPSLPEPPGPAVPPAPHACILTLVTPVGTVNVELGAPAP